MPEVMEEALRAGRPESWPTPPLWDGRAGERIAAVVAAALER
jgi:UDP-N-acetylglucosamine 2-epimerase (non-hydrolysing)